MTGAYQGRCRRRCGIFRKKSPHQRRLSEQALDQFDRHLGRILAIYIRDVQVPARALLVGPVVQELEAEHVPMLLVPDYATAAIHAASLGLVLRD